MNEVTGSKQLARLVALHGHVFLKDAEIIVSDFFQHVEDTLVEGKDVTVNGLGRFHVVQARRRMLHDVSSHEMREVDGYPTVSFRPGRKLKNVCAD